MKINQELISEDCDKKWPFLSNKIDRNIQYSSIFVFYLELILADYQSFPIHVVIKNDGFANNFIYETRNDLIERLNQFHIQCFFTSTDGDKFFNDEHESAFNEYKQLLESGSSFEDIISILKSIFLDVLGQFRILFIV